MENLPDRSPFTIDSPRCLDDSTNKLYSFQESQIKGRIYRQTKLKSRRAIKKKLIYLTKLSVHHR